MGDCVVYIYTHEGYRRRRARVIQQRVEILVHCAYLLIATQWGLAVQEPVEHVAHHGQYLAHLVMLAGVQACILRLLGANRLASEHVADVVLDSLQEGDTSDKLGIGRLVTLEHRDNGRLAHGPCLGLELTPVFGQLLAHHLLQLLRGLGLGGPVDRPLTER